MRISYSANFISPSKLSRLRWLKQRRVRINKARFIKVLLHDVNIKILSRNLVLVCFVQTYKSNSYQDQVNKQLLLNNTNGS